MLPSRTGTHTATTTGAVQSKVCTTSIRTANGWAGSMYARMSNQLAKQATRSRPSQLLRRTTASGKTIRSTCRNNKSSLAAGTLATTGVMEGPTGMRLNTLKYLLFMKRELTCTTLGMLTPAVHPTPPGGINQTTMLGSSLQCKKEPTQTGPLCGTIRRRLQRAFA
jgi:hypothetical protein